VCVSFIVFVRILRLGPSSTNDSATSLDHLEYKRSRADIIARRYARKDSREASSREQKKKRKERIPKTTGDNASLLDYDTSHEQKEKRDELVANAHDIHIKHLPHIQRKKRLGRGFPPDTDELSSNGKKR